MKCSLERHLVQQTRMPECLKIKVITYLFSLILKKETALTRMHFSTERLLTQTRPEYDCSVVSRYLERVNRLNRFSFRPVLQDTKFDMIAMSSICRMSEDIYLSVLGEDEQSWCV